MSLFACCASTGQLPDAVGIHASAAAANQRDRAIALLLARPSALRGDPPEAVPVAGEGG